jgi:Ankyrin repeats (3 copies)
MKDNKYFAPVLVGILVTPVFCLFAMISAGAGHGSYVAAIVLFPFTLLLASFIGGENELVLIASAILQFPLYGIFLGYANTRGRMLTAAAALFVVHLLAVGFFAVGPDLVSASSSEQLEEAVRNNDLAAAKRLLDAGDVDPNYVRPYSTHLLNLALGDKAGNFEMLKLLLEHGADSNYQNKHWDNHTPLYSASTLYSEQVVKLLLDHGADPNMRDTSGESVLEHAKKSRDYSLAHRGPQHYSDEKQAEDERIIALLEAAAKHTQGQTEQAPSPPTE